MKRFIILLLAIFIVLSSCVIPKQEVSLLATATPKPNSCQVWSTKSVIEHDGNYDENGYGAFAQIIGSDGGVTAWVQFPKDLIDTIKTLNGPDVANLHTYQQMYESNQANGYGNYYRIVDGISPDVAIWWNWVGPPSPDQAYHPGERNFVCVDRVANGYAYIVAAPKSSDYNQYTQYKWLVWHIYANWRGTPQLFNTLAVAPDSGYVLSGKSNMSFKIPVSWLLEYQQTIDIPWRVTATQTPTITPSPTFTPTFTPTVTPTPTSTPASQNEIVVYISASPWLSMRPDPGMSNIPTGNYYIGSKVFITQTFTDKSGNVFGQTRNGDWLALLLRGRYYTTWRP